MKIYLSIAIRNLNSALIESKMNNQHYKFFSSYLHRGKISKLCKKTR